MSSELDEHLAHIGKYPSQAWGYDGKLHLERVTNNEWRQFRMRQARRKGTHTKAQWLELRDRIGRCVICGATDLPLAKDHIIAVAAGGCDCIENIQPLCHPCNSSKCDR